MSDAAQRLCGATIGNVTCEAPAGHTGLHEARVDTGILVWGLEDAR